MSVSKIFEEATYSSESNNPCMKVISIDFIQYYRNIKNGAICSLSLIYRNAHCH